MLLARVAMSVGRPLGASGDDEDSVGRDRGAAVGKKSGCSMLFRAMVAISS